MAVILRADETYIILVPAQSPLKGILSITIVDGIVWQQDILRHRLEVDTCSQIEILISISSVTVRIDEGETKFIPQLTVNLPYRIDIRVDGQGEQQSFQKMEEISFVEERVLIAADHAADSQHKKVIGNFLDHHRFLSFLKLNFFDIDVRNKVVLVSGCSSGNECYVLHKLGAKTVVGMDPNRLALSVALSRYSEIDGLFFSDSDSEFSDLRFDLIISRHVIEHIPEEERQNYVERLASRLSPDGLFFVEVPNQRSVVEAHTGVRFFHWFEKSRQIDILNEIEENMPDIFSDDEIKTMKKIVGHKNIEIDSLLAIIPDTLRLVSNKYLNYRRIPTESPMGSAIQFLFKRG